MFLMGSTLAVPRVRRLIGLALPLRNEVVLTVGYCGVPAFGTVVVYGTVVGIFLLKVLFR